MASRLIMAGLLISLLALGLLGAVSIAQSQETPSSSSTCDQVVRHTGFMDEEAIASVNETGSATSTVSNTVVTVEEATGFVRIKADNPNGYCVAYVVEISPEIVPAADLGVIDSNSGDVEASWRAVQNLSAGTVRTRVEFTLEPDSSATFAPSKARVKSLAWTGSAKESGISIASTVSGWWGSDVLDQRKYQIEPTESADSITVPLEDGEGNTVEEWIASYELEGRERDVTQDASAPVYYTASEGSVTFHFNDKRADVTFIADPTPVDKIGHSASSYFSGLGDVGDWIPLQIGRVPA